MTYLVLAAIAAGFALIPLPLFPSWVVVAYMVVAYLHQPYSRRISSALTAT